MSVSLDLRKKVTQERLRTDHITMMEMLQKATDDIAKLEKENEHYKMLLSKYELDPNLLVSEKQVLKNTQEMVHSLKDEIASLEAKNTEIEKMYSLKLQNVQNHCKIITDSNTTLKTNNKALELKTTELENALHSIGNKSTNVAMLKTIQLLKVQFENLKMEYLQLKNMEVEVCTGDILSQINTEIRNYCNRQFSFKSPVSDVAKVDGPNLRKKALLIVSDSDECLKKSSVDENSINLTAEHSIGIELKTAKQEVLNLKQKLESLTSANQQLKYNYENSMKQISNNALINKPMDSDNMVNNEEHSNTSVCESDPISVNIHEYMLLKNENKSLKLEVLKYSEQLKALHASRHTPKVSNDILRSNTSNSIQRNKETSIENNNDNNSINNRNKASHSNKCINKAKQDCSSKKKSNIGS